MLYIPSPKDLRELRLRAGLTQRELAQRAGVSQTLIARIEKGDVNPRLSTLKRIYDVLMASLSEGGTAGHIMHSPLITVNQEDSVAKAVELMDKHGISQLPVMDNAGRVVGTVYEATILKHLIAYPRGRKVRKINPNRTPVKEIMDPPMPSVPPDTELHVIARLLIEYPAILVVDSTGPRGIITKIDLLKYLTSTGTSDRKGRRRKR